VVHERVEIAHYYYYYSSSSSLWPTISRSAPDFLSSLLSPELLILTLLPLHFAWHLQIDGGSSIIYNNSEEENAPVPTRGKHSMPGEVHNRQTAQNGS
jgi:hypothetical protein